MGLLENGNGCDVHKAQVMGKCLRCLRLIQLDTDEAPTCSDTILTEYSEKDLLDFFLDMNHLDSRPVTDFPMCNDCTSLFFTHMDERLNYLIEENVQYAMLIESLESRRGSTTKYIRCKNDELKQLQIEEQKLMTELEELESEDSALGTKLARMKQQVAPLMEREEDAMRSLRDAIFQHVTQERESHDLVMKSRYADSQLLNHNVAMVAFPIRTKGEIGSICGFRLGRLNTDPVEWHEINFALGCAAQLLRSLTTKMRINLGNYKICPFGEKSYIQLVDTEDKLPLHRNSTCKYFSESAVDDGIVALFQCLHLLTDVLSDTFHQSCPFYMGNKGFCGNYAVRLTFNSLKTWTAAMKAFLCNLHWASVLVHDTATWDRHGSISGKGFKRP